MNEGNNTTYTGVLTDKIVRNFIREMAYMNATPVPYKEINRAALPAASHE